MALPGASFSDGASREVPESGRYLCNLVSVEGYQHTVKTTGKQMPMLRWTFQTAKQVDSEGLPYSFTKMTSTRYGGDESWLTQLLDQMLGKRLTRSEFEGLDVEGLKAKAWVVAITKTVNSRGYDQAEVDSVKEHKGEAKPAPAPAKPKVKPAPVKVDDIGDPFDEEDEEDDLPFL